MNIFPNNKRNEYTNKLIKPISLTHNSGLRVYVAVDSVTIENSIIQYPSINDFPDIFCFNHSIEDEPDTFKLPEVYFENSQKLIQFLKSNCVHTFLKNICLRDGKVSLETNGKYTFVSIRLFDFLRIPKESSFRVLGIDWLDGRFTRYYENYYVVELGDLKIFHGAQKFDLYINTPRLIKIVSSNIKQYLCGGGYRNELATIPIKCSKRTSFFTPKSNNIFPSIPILYPVF